MRKSRFLRLIAALTLSAHLGLAAASIEEARQLLRERNPEAALGVIDQTLDAQPANPELRFLKGVALAELQRLDEAIAVFQRLSADHPELPEPYNNLAVLHAQRGDFEQARIALELAIQTHPAYATAHENLGDVYSRLASQAYSKALQLDDSNSAAQTKLAMMHELMSSTQGSVPQPVAVAPVSPVTTLRPSVPVSSTQIQPSGDPAGTDVRKGASEGVTLAVLQVERAVSAWAGAWEAKNMDSYLGAYDASFSPAGGLSRERWAQQRFERIAERATPITVALSDLNVEVSGTRAVASFSQRYEAGSIRSTVSKELRLIQRGDRWLITSENVR